MGQRSRRARAAQQLNWAGHSVVVFEKDDRIGGLLMYGIPDYKIEKWVVDRRVALMEEEGVEFRTNSYVGYDPTTEELKSEFDAIILAVGALQGRDLPSRPGAGRHPPRDGLPGAAEPAGRRPPVEEEEIPPAARTSSSSAAATRAPTASATPTARAAPRSRSSPTARSRPTTPARWSGPTGLHPPHLPGPRGGRRARLSVAVTGFSGSNGHVEKMHAVQTERTTEGKTEPIPGTDFEIEADLVLLAIGFTGPVRDRFLQDLGLGYTERGAIPARNGFGTSEPGVFVAGDAKRGASSSSGPSPRAARPRGRRTST